MARDVVTGAGGHVEVRSSARLWLHAEGMGGIVVEIGSDPAEPRLDALIGAPVMVGFRRRLAEALPDHVAAWTPLYRLLDDVPLAFLVSGHAMMLGEPEPEPEPEPDPDPADAPGAPGPRAAGGLGPAPRRGPALDVCAGWQADGMLGQLLQGSGNIPHSLGPPAPVLGGEDPEGWHARSPVPVRVTRRTRRLDVAPSAGGVAIDLHFRDSYGHLDGSERSLHEYTIDAEAGDDGTILRASASPRALPWPECPQAVGSAERLRGLRLQDLPERVRREFTGITTCTHLNDTMRSLADAGALMALVAVPMSSATPLREEQP